MKRIKNTLVIPFWAQHFSRLRMDENVNAGHFRIGMLILETKINNCFCIVAKITEDRGPRKDIDYYAMELVSQLKDRIAQYEEGLLCAAQFLNEVHSSSEEAHDDAEYSKCSQRFSGCDNYGCPAIKTPGSEHVTEKMEKFVASYGK